MPAPRYPRCRIGLLRYALDSAWEAEDVATVPERIAAFLKGHRQQPYCDGCLEKLLGLGAGANRYMARNATSALAQTTEFRRREGSCSHCGKFRMVIAAQ